MEARVVKRCRHCGTEFIALNGYNPEENDVLLLCKCCDGEAKLTVMTKKLEMCLALYVLTKHMDEVGLFNFISSCVEEQLGKSKNVMAASSTILGMLYNNEIDRINLIGWFIDEQLNVPPEYVESGE